VTAPGAGNPAVIQPNSVVALLARWMWRGATAAFWHPGFTLIALMYLQRDVVQDPRGKHLIALGIELAAVAAAVLGAASIGARVKSPYTHRLRPDGRWERIQNQPTLRQRVHDRGRYVQVKAQKGNRLTAFEKTHLRGLHWRNRYVGRVTRRVLAREDAEREQLGATTPRSRWENWALRNMPTEKTKRTKADRSKARMEKDAGRAEKSRRAAEWEAVQAAIAERAQAPAPPTVGFDPAAPPAPPKPAKKATSAAKATKAKRKAKALETTAPVTAKNGARVGHDPAAPPPPPAPGTGPMAPVVEAVTRLAAPAPRRAGHDPAAPPRPPRSEAS
jgi:hypothetical protein